MSPYGTFTPEEWAMVKSAPMMAANMVMAADPSGPMGMMKEVMAAAKIISSKESAYAQNGLVGAILADWEAAAQEAKDNKVSAMDFAKQQMPELPQFKTPEEMIAWAGQALTDTVGVVAQKDPADATVFNQWVMDSAVAAANAAKEGSFLGIGGAVVSEAEQAALDRIKGILGL
jgi:hypothetical protein